MKSAFDIYVFGRILANRHINGEVASLSPRSAAVAEHLISLSPGDRLIAWRGHLCGREDREEIAQAIAEVDPDGPPPDPSVAPAPPPRAKLTRAADVTCRDVEWEWEGRVPRGMLTLMAGDPKLGKSLISVGMAAARSRGVPHPGEAHGDHTPGSTILLNAEDDASRTIVPRLISAGANLDKVHLLEAVYLGDGAEALPNLVADLDAIEEAIASVGDCRLVVIDPISAYLGRTDDHRNSELRGMLSPLKALAERHNVAVVLVSHLTKGKGTNALHRVTGSVAYTGASRANHVVVRDPEDETGRRVLMVSAGGNLAEPPPTLAYRVVDRGSGAVIEWEAEPVAITAEQALAAAAADHNPEEHTERSECVQWLRETLECGRVLAKDIESQGRAMGFSTATMKRAKAKLGAKTNREGFGVGSQCYWSLPGPIEFDDHP